MVLKAYIFTTDVENIVDRMYNTRDNAVNESGRLVFLIRLRSVF